MDYFKKVLEGKIPETLYHYTDGQGLLGIIRKEQFWASHIRFMNDLKEEIYSLDCLEKCLSESEENVSKIMESVKTEFHKETSEKSIFVVSFSEKKDNLNQWRGYADKIPAYCIGFDYEKLKENGGFCTNVEKIIERLNKTDSSSTENPFVFLLPCIYEKDEQDSLIKEVVNDSKKKIGNNDYENLGKEIARRLIYYSPLIKHEMSKDEEEWRLIIVYEDLQTSKDEAVCNNFKNTPSKQKKDFINFRMGKSLIIPYYEFKIQKKSVKEVIIGACPDMESVKESTSYFLTKHGLKNNLLVETKNPYRNW